MKDKTITLTNGVTLEVKESTCLYCGNDILSDTGKVFIVFPMDLLYNPNTTIEHIGYLAHSYCLTKEAMYFNKQMMAALELGTVTEAPKSVYIEENLETHTQVPVGTKRGIEMVEQ
jgi:hypothetical protein